MKKPPEIFVDCRIEKQQPGHKYGHDLVIKYGFHDSPFGFALLMKSQYGLMGLGFADDMKDAQNTLSDMTARWPEASYIKDQHATGKEAAHIFSPDQWASHPPLQIILAGTAFQVSVWKELLKIPPGHSLTYGELAQRVKKPRAHRAVGSAVGRNPISFVVPCHRILRKDGNPGGYHWSLARKRKMIEWEKDLLPPPLKTKGVNKKNRPRATI